MNAKELITGKDYIVKRHSSKLVVTLLEIRELHSFNSRRLRHYVCRSHKTKRQITIKSAGAFSLPPKKAA